MDHATFNFASFNIQFEDFPPTFSLFKIVKEMASLKSWITSNVYCYSAFHINATLFSSSVIRFFKIDSFFFLGK